MSWGYGEEFISEARWLWSQPQENPPMSAYLRNEIEINGEVKRAYFYSFRDKRGRYYLNGEPLALHPWETLRKYRGHVKGIGVEIGKMLKPGENVLAIQLDRNQVGCFGVILRGEIEYADGRKAALVSSARQFKASGFEAEGWNRVDFDASGWLPAWEQGDARMRPWSKYGNTTMIYCTPEEYQRFSEHVTEGFPEQALLKEPVDPVCRVVYNGRTPALIINGERFAPHILSGVKFTPSADQDSAIRHTAQAGVSIYALSFNIGAFSTGFGSYDFEEFNLGIRRILALDPKAHFVITMEGTPPDDWMEKHPDELVEYAIKNDNKHNSNYYANTIAPSFASEAYRQETARMLRIMAEYMRSQPWGRRIVGLILAHGGSCDGMPWGCHCMPDTGKRMTEAFRLFLKGKYGSDKALQTAWNEPGVTLETALVPDETKRLGSGNYLKNGGDPRDVRVSDYYELYHRVFSDYMLAKGKAAKEVFPGRLVGSYYGYLILSYEPEGSTANFEEVIRSPCYDMLWATTRGYNLTDGLPRHIYSIFQRYGKIGFIEGDIRAHTGTGEAEPQWFCRTPEETRATFRKLIGNTLLYGCGYEAPDFGNRKKWFDCPEALESMAKGVEIWKRQFQSSTDWNSEVAVILEPSQVWKQGHPIYRKTFLFSDALLTHPLQTLNFCGIPYDAMTLEDYLASSHPYKAVVFLNLFEVTASQRERLFRKLHRPGITAIWNYAPGLLAPEGYSDRSMKELTGLDLRCSAAPRPFNVKLADGKRMGIFGAAHDYTETPRVSCYDANAEFLGRFSDDDSGALVRKALPEGGNSVFAGLPVNRSVVWAELLKAAGCHAYTESGFMVRRNNRLLMVFSGKNTNIPPESRIMKENLSQKGELTVTLPGKAQVVKDCFTDGIIAQESQSFILKSDQPCTWLMEVIAE